MPGVQSIFGVRKAEFSFEEPMKRYLVFPIHFDTRSSSLDEEQSSWDDSVKENHRDNKANVIEGLQNQFGKREADTKIQNFRDLGYLPFSIVSYHNKFFQQARDAFVIGAYYSAATGACGLAERILNHLIIDLRDQFSHTPEYKTVYSKKSFDDWDRAINVLAAWNVLRLNVPTLFRKMKGIRNRLIHFDPTTYDNDRAIALESLRLLAEIVSIQFGFFRQEHWWAIKGTRGANFISKAAEQDPFIKTFYLPRCPLVGPYYAANLVEQGWLFFDREQYPQHEISDDEFAQLYGSRRTDEVVPSEPSSDVRLTGCVMTNGVYLAAERTSSDGIGWILNDPIDSIARREKDGLTP
jgi:hypothetical protein